MVQQCCRHDEKRSNNIIKDTIEWMVYAEITQYKKNCSKKYKKKKSLYTFLWGEKTTGKLLKKCPCDMCFHGNGKTITNYIISDFF